MRDVKRSIVHVANTTPHCVVGSKEFANVFLMYFGLICFSYYWQLKP